MKKLIIAALICATAFSLFGCQNSKTESSKSTASAASSQTANIGDTEDLVCTVQVISEEEPKEMKISDSRAHELYNIVTTNLSGNFDKDLDLYNNITELCFSVGGEPRVYFYVADNDAVFSNESPELSNQDFVGWSDGIYKKITDIVNKK